MEKRKMPSNKGKKSISVEYPHNGSIDGIIHWMESFEYNVDRSIIDDNQEDGEIKRPSSIEQTQKRNLEELLKSLTQIKYLPVKVQSNSGELSKDESIIVDDQELFKNKVKDLYSLLKSKLGNDLYLLNVKLLIKFFDGYENTGVDKFDTPTKYLLDEILAEVKNSLISTLTEYSFKSLANLFNGSNIEQNLSVIIRSVLEEKKKNKENENRLIVLSNLYIFLVLTNRLSNGYIEKIFEVESVMGEYIFEAQVPSKSKYLHKKFPEALLNKDPKGKIKSSIHLYRGVRNKDLKDQVQTLENQITETRRTLSQQAKELENLKESTKDKDNRIEQLEQDGIVKDNEIENLNEELKNKSDRLDFEVNKHQRQYSHLRNGLISGIQKRTQRAFDDLTVLAGRLPQDEGEELRDWVRDLKIYFDSLRENN
jgi:hypothetical protein